MWLWLRLVGVKLLWVRTLCSRWIDYVWFLVIEFGLRVSSLAGGYWCVLFSPRASRLQCCCCLESLGCVATLCDYLKSGQFGAVQS